jgi:hypothetical protein
MIETPDKIYNMTGLMSILKYQHASFSIDWSLVWTITLFTRSIYENQGHMDKDETESNLAAGYCTSTRSNQKGN